MQQKRYYWLKLQDGFFNSKRIKKLRKLAGGDTYTIIYLKMQLLAMKTDGILRWTGLEDDFASELALDLDEEPENVAVTLQYLLSCGLAETDDNVAFFLPWAVENVGSEGSSTKRVREYRERKALQCNADATPMKQIGNVEKEIDTEIDKDVEIERDVVADKPRKQKFSPPTLEEVEAYVKERNSPIDAKEFFAFYNAGDWYDSKGNKVKNWKQKLLTWERHEPQKKITTAADYNSKKQAPVDAGQMDGLKALLEEMNNYGKS